MSLLKKIRRPNLPWLLLFPWSRRGQYFRLELASRYRWYLGPGRTSLIALCLVLGFWILWLVAQSASVIVDRNEMQARVDQIRGQDAELIARAQGEDIDLSTPSLQRLPTEVLLANQLLGKRNFSWTQFLTGLEGSIPQHVSVKSVRLDPVSAKIYLTGVAVTVDDVTAFALQLQDHPIFREPLLGQHHTGPDGLVQFDLSLKYHPQDT